MLGSFDLVSLCLGVTLIVVCCYLVMALVVVLVD